ncbi:GGDEF domain-containing protein, partial [Thermodesulfobacteriota bacterium]
SITDSLTNLFNQRHFYSRLKEEVVRANRQARNLTLMLMDLDEFKAYNDAHGHLAGDDILRSVGKIIQNSIRDGVDSGYRYGGDEFAVILIEADLDIAKEIGRRIQDSLLELENMSLSLGYSKFAEKMSAKDLVSAADNDLYDSKKNNHH